MRLYILSYCNYKFIKKTQQGFTVPTKLLKIFCLHQEFGLFLVKSGKNKLQGLQHKTHWMVRKKKKFLIMNRILIGLINIFNAMFLQILFLYYL